MDFAGIAGVRESSSEGKHSAWHSAYAFKTGEPEPLLSLKSVRNETAYLNSCSIAKAEQDDFIGNVEKTEKSA